MEGIFISKDEDGEEESCMQVRRTGWEDIHTIYMHLLGLYIFMNE
jgi:hypothetical protein